VGSLGGRRQVENLHACWGEEKEPILRWVKKSWAEREVRVDSFSGKVLIIGGNWSGVGGKQRVIERWSISGRGLGKKG